MTYKISDPPRFENKEIKSFIKENYGLTVKIESLVSDIGQNFHLLDLSGKEYILKIANNNESVAMLEAQNAVLEHLNNKNLDFHVPNVVKNLKGDKICKITGMQDRPHQARLLSYLAGKFLADISPYTVNQMKALGKLLGNLDKCLQDFVHPAIYRYWHWDLKNIPDIRPLTNHIPDPSGKRLVDYFILQFESEVLSNSFKMRKSLIHNDANDHNILVSEENRQAEINGIIDFGDMVYSHTIFELAVTLAYIMSDNNDPLAPAFPVIQAYHQISPLQESEIEALFYSICARLSLSVTMAAFQQSLQPDNKYLSVSEQSAWSLLDQMIQMNPEKARQSFMEACSAGQDHKDTSSVESILEDRKTYIGRSLSISYKKPIHIVRGAFQYLYDQTGKTYLDCVNNVCHVGHAHPTVVRAAQHQIGLLNTNTRYLHHYLVQYAKRLTDSLPDPLQVCFFVNSGSEANELALRLARTHTNQKNVIVIDHAYHGNTPELIDISPYKFDGKGGQGPGSFTHKTVMPDLYRGSHKKNDPQSGLKYASYVMDIITNLKRQNQGLAAFIGESLIGCGGQIVLPDEYLENVYQMIRASGGICIADEVQVGFGRIGAHFWGFELQNVVPDIVTLGKPIGNGHPMAAVICTREIADSFVTGMEYFNTFGGNPVSCATGMAVLDVIAEENLQENALRVGRRMMNGFEELKNRHPLIGDVRGAGLFIGVELVTDQKTLNPATKEAAKIIERMKDQGILLSTDGPFENVIKIKPPIVFNEDNADRVVNTIDDVLKSL